jgi:hypothetical protein
LRIVNGRTFKTSRDAYNLLCYLLNKEEALAPSGTPMLFFYKGRTGFIHMQPLYARQWCEADEPSDHLNTVLTESELGCWTNLH